MIASQLNCALFLSSPKQVLIMVFLYFHGGDFLYKAMIVVSTCLCMLNIGMARPYATSKKKTLPISGSCSRTGGSVTRTMKQIGRPKFFE